MYEYDLMGVLVDKESNIIKLPFICLKVIFNVLDKKKADESLVPNLQLDIDRAQDLLGWSPSFSPKQLIKSLD
jgi:hypothetical protein